MDKFTFIDLFAGVGGFHFALANVGGGGICVYSSEIDENACKTYALNHNITPFGDITKDKIQNKIPKKFDILCGGFPCQAFSIAGYQKGFDDTRGTFLYYKKC